MEIFVLLIFLFSPAIIIYLCLKFPILNKIGPVLLSYILGIFIGNIGMIPESAKYIQENSSSISVILGLAMILFSTDIRKWFSLAKKSILSFFLGSLSVLLCVIFGYFLFNNNIQELWKISGMLIGVYTGGTPNMAAI